MKILKKNIYFCFVTWWKFRKSSKTFFEIEKSLNLNEEAKKKKIFIVKQEIMKLIELPHVCIINSRFNKKKQTNLISIQ